MAFPLRDREAEERSHYFPKGDDQSSGSITVGHIQEQPNCLSSDQPVVTSYEKACLFCELYSPIDEPDSSDDQGQHIQPEQNEVDDQDQEAPEQHQQYHQDSGQQQHTEGQQISHSKGRRWDHDQAMRGVTGNELPPLLYRWSNSESQGVNSKTFFQAALFCNGEWYNPEDFSEDRFERFFRSHVTKQEVKTPFISTSQSPLAPIQRALANQNNAIVTVIDTSKLDTKVFYACPLAIRTRTLVHNGWKGYGEYLIWGRIPTEAIVLALEIATLERIASLHHDIYHLMQIPLIRGARRCDQKLREMLASKRKAPFKSGRTFGKLLTILQVPRVHWDNLASEFAKSWGWKNKQEIAQFFRGLRKKQPYLTGQLSQCQSEAPIPTPQETPGNTMKMDLLYDSFADLDNEPRETEEDPEGRLDSDGQIDSQSMSMDEITGTEEEEEEEDDDEKSTTHESLSSGPDDHTPEVIDISSDDDETSSQRALQHEWPSDDDLCPETPTPIGLKIPLPVEGNAFHHGIDDRLNMDFSERVRLWALA
jgi:hypothetical protein